MRFKRKESYYSPAQVVQYLQHVSKTVGTNLPTFSLSAQDVEAGAFPCTVENLELLMRFHLLSFPFEDTAMHYTPQHQMGVSSEGIFDRLVLAGKGYGSYCFGNNTLLLGVLRGLGYRAISTPGRVNSNLSSNLTTCELTIQSHMVLLVQSDEFKPINDTNPHELTYVVDVGFGTYVLARPIPLIADTTVAGSAPPEEFRLIRGYHPDTSLSLDSNSATSPESHSRIYPPDWILQVRNGTDIPTWRDTYHFVIAETFPADHEAWNHTLHREVKGPGSAPFWGTVMAVKHFVVEGNAEDLDVGVDGRPRVKLGKVYVVGTSVTKRVGDVREKVKDVKNELERVRALKEYVGIGIEDGDIVHIQGRSSALPV